MEVLYPKKDPQKWIVRTDPDERSPIKFPIIHSALDDQRLRRGLERADDLRNKHGLPIVDDIITIVQGVWGLLRK